MQTGKTIASLVCVILSQSVSIAGSMGSAENSSVGMTPVITLFGGTSFFNLKYPTKTYIGTSDDVFKYYHTQQNKTTGMLGGFLGVEHPFLKPGLSMQTGIEYSAYQHRIVKGSHSVGIEPSTYTNYQYQYNWQTNQLLVIGKVLYTVLEICRPYLSVGLGAAFNHSNAFRVDTQQAGSTNVAPIFQNRSQAAFSYGLALGVDAQASQHIRLGMGYRFTSIGKSVLNKAWLTNNRYRQPVPFSLSTSNIYANQLIAQVTYLF